MRILETFMGACQAFFFIAIGVLVMPDMLAKTNETWLFFFALSIVGSAILAIYNGLILENKNNKGGNYE